MSCEVIETALTRALCEVCVVFEPDTLSDSMCKASPSSSYETTSEEYHSVASVASLGTFWGTWP